MCVATAHSGGVSRAPTVIMSDGNGHGSGHGNGHGSGQDTSSEEEERRQCYQLPRPKSRTSMGVGSPALSKSYSSLLF